MALCITFSIEILLRIKKMGVKYIGIKIIVFVDNVCFAFLFYAFPTSPFAQQLQSR